MAVDTYPSREPTTHRDVRLAVGRQMTRTILFCALSLIAGIAIGHFFLKQQLQVQQGVVGQLQREIRGLTGDIQRLELEHSKSISRFESVIDRLERNHLVALTGESQNNQHRLAGLRNNVERQLSRLNEEHASLLAELEPYQQRHLAVPTDLLVESLTRLLTSRRHDLQQLLDDVRSHVNHEHARQAAIQGQWLLGQQPARGESTVALDTPLAAFAATSSVAATTANPESTIATAVDSTTTTIPAATDVDVFNPADSDDVPHELTAAQEASAAATILVNSAQSTTPTARRPLVGGPGRRRPYYQLISFGSGRVVTPNVPTPRSTSVAEAEKKLDTAEAATDSAAR